MEKSSLLKLLQLIARPSSELWLDGRAITMLTNVTISDVPIVNGQTKMVAPANASRLAIGFSYPDLQVLTQYVSPWSDPETFGFYSPVPGEPGWFNAKDFPGIIGNAWYINAQVDNVLRVIEVLRTNGV